MRTPSSGAGAAVHVSRAPGPPLQPSGASRTRPNGRSPRAARRASRARAPRIDAAGLVLQTDVAKEALTRSCRVRGASTPSPNARPPVHVRCRAARADEAPPRLGRPWDHAVARGVADAATRVVSNDVRLLTRPPEHARAEAHRSTRRTPTSPGRCFVIGGLLSDGRDTTAGASSTSSRALRRRTRSPSPRGRTRRGRHRGTPTRSKALVIDVLVERRLARARSRHGPWRDPRWTTTMSEPRRKLPASTSTRRPSRVARSAITTTMRALDDGGPDRSATLRDQLDPIAEISHRGRRGWSEPRSALRAVHHEGLDPIVIRLDHRLESRLLPTDASSRSIPRASTAATPTGRKTRHHETFASSNARRTRTPTTRSLMDWSPSSTVRQAPTHTRTSRTRARVATDDARPRCPTVHSTPFRTPARPCVHHAPFEIKP